MKKVGYRPRLSEAEQKLLEEYRNNNSSNVLVIGDLHEPFCLDGYLDFCKHIYETQKCNKVVFIGDVIDNHYSSYHETDADGYGGGEELEIAISKIAKRIK